MDNNGILDFDDFLNIFPKYNKFKNNKIAEEIFDELKKVSIIQNMIDISDFDKPALIAPIYTIESSYGSQKEFDLNDHFVKQCIGAMIKVILEPFGYQPIKQKDMPKGLSKFFRSASVYHRDKDKEPQLKIVLKIEKTQS